MQHFLSILTLLAATLAVCNGSHLTNSSPADISAAADLEQPGSSVTNTTATVSGNNVVISRSNILVFSDQDKKTLVDTIKRMVTINAGSGSQDDDTGLTTQIVALLGAGSNATSRSTIKMLPQIKSAYRNRGKPAKLNQIVVKLVESSPRAEAATIAAANAAH